MVKPNYNHERRVMRVGAVELQLVFENEKLCAIELPKQIPVELDATTLKQIVAELSQYEFTLDSKASEFTRRVWHCMREVPAGKTITYSELAAMVGKPGAARAVGNAVGANRLLILLPCHRVVARTGLGGFREGLEWKRKLLELERAG